jgi:hypothetical protein
VDQNANYGTEFSVLKSLRTISRENSEVKTNVSDISSASIIRIESTLTLMKEISETLVFNSTLTRLMARDDFSTV